jgi:hypothetical protein
MKSLKGIKMSFLNLKIFIIYSLRSLLKALNNLKDLSIE